MQDKKVLFSAADSFTRVAGDRSSVAESLDLTKVQSRTRAVTNPSSPSSTMKKAGILLLVGTPDPFTAVPGAALLAASYASKRRAPARLDDVAAEASRILEDVQGSSL